MERIRYRVGRLRVHLADDVRMAELLCSLEQIRVEQAPQPMPPIRRGYNDAIDIDEFFEPAAEPEKVSAVIIVTLPEGQQQRCARRDERPTRADAIIRSKFSRVISEVSRALALLTSSSVSRAEASLWRSLISVVIGRSRRRIDEKSASRERVTA